MTETVPVEFTVLGVETVQRGRIAALANVRVEVSGLAFILQGVRVVRLPGGGWTVEGPHWRHPADGRWLPALSLPDELREAIGAEVLTVMGGG